MADLELIDTMNRVHARGRREALEEVEALIEMQLATYHSEEGLAYLTLTLSDIKKLPRESA